MTARKTTTTAVLRIVRLVISHLYAYTVTDPQTWISRWSALLSFKRTDSPIYEYVCHEGNHALANILAGERAAEKAEKE